MTGNDVTTEFLEGEINRLLPKLWGNDRDLVSSQTTPLVRRYQLTRQLVHYTGQQGWIALLLLASFIAMVIGAIFVYGGFNTLEARNAVTPGNSRGAAILLATIVLAYCVYVASLITLIYSWAVQTKVERFRTELEINHKLRPTEGSLPETRVEQARTLPTTPQSTTGQTRDGISFIRKSRTNQVAKTAGVLGLLGTGLVWWLRRTRLK